MEDLMSVAKYLVDNYRIKTNCEMDEMKLHKLLYFAQRESLLKSNEPLFSDDFLGWKFGPVIPSVRRAYKNAFHRIKIKELSSKAKRLLDYILEKYGKKNSWTLVRMTHNEISWLESRKNLSENEQGNVKINLEDIRKDAEWLKKRRTFLKSI